MKTKYQAIEKKIEELMNAAKEKNPVLFNYLKKNLNLAPKYC